LGTEISAQRENLGIEAEILHKMEARVA